jgi:hypothetical protein
LLLFLVTQVHLKILGVIVLVKNLQNFNVGEIFSSTFFWFKNCCILCQMAKTKKIILTFIFIKYTQWRA